MSSRSPSLTVGAKYTRWLGPKNTPSVLLFSSTGARSGHSRPVANSLPTISPVPEGMSSTMRATTLPAGYSELSAIWADTSLLPSPSHVRLIFTHCVSDSNSNNPYTTGMLS